MSLGLALGAQGCQHDVFSPYTQWDRSKDFFQGTSCRFYASSDTLFWEGHGGCQFGLPFEAPDRYTSLKAGSLRTTRTWATRNNAQGINSIEGECEVFVVVSLLTTLRQCFFYNELHTDVGHHPKIQNKVGRTVAGQLATWGN